MNLAATRGSRRPLPWLRGLALLAIAVCVGLGSARMAQLQRAEFVSESEPASLRERMQAEHATRISARLGEAQLQADQHVVFELCAEADLAAPVFQRAFELVVLRLAAQELMLRVPLDPPHLAHVAHGSDPAAASCLMLGSGTIEHSGSYSVEAVWQGPPPTAAGVLEPRLVLRILAKPLLTARDFALVAWLGAAALSFVVAMLIAAPAPTGTPVTRDKQTKTGVYAPFAALALIYALMQWPSVGALQTTCKGVLLLGVQALLSLWAAGRFGEHGVREELGLARPPLVAGVAGALLAWPSLVASARLALRWVPSTGTAPLQTFIAQPSGMLSAAVLGVLLPIGEELFFRGYVFGAWARFGKLAAAVGSGLVFGLLHAPQSWGNWGGLAAVFITGAVLCALRALTGSTWLAMLTHLAYNLTLSLTSLAAAIAAG